jgi:hypothetical protein
MGACLPAEATNWVDREPGRARTAVAAELLRTTAVAVASSAALVGLLGGVQLLQRTSSVARALGAGGAVMLVGLLLLALWGLWRTAAVVRLLREDLAAPESALPRLDQRADGRSLAERLGRAVRTTQRLPYCLAGGFLGAGVAGGVVTAIQLGGLRAEDRMMAALLWGFGYGLAALGVLLRLRSFLAPLAQALQVRAPESVRPLLSARSKLLYGFGWLLLCVTSLSLLKQLLLGQVQPLALRGLLFLLPVQVAAAGAVVALAVVGLAWPVRDLLRRAAAVVGEARGALQRPIVLGVSAPAEVIEQQRLFEQLRRLLLSRLRSSTEQNLQLEAEVARRTGELSRRHEELSDALFRLQSAREELLRAEKLATVGRIAAGITGEIDAPVARMSDFCGQLAAAIQGLMASLPLPPGPAEAAELRLNQALSSLAALTDGATRVRDIVRAMRVYVRPGETQPGRCDVKDVLKDVGQLFGEPLRHCIQVPGDEPATAAANLVVTVRSDLALLLASWLVRVEPRLRDLPEPRVVVRTRLVPSTGPGQSTTAQLCELTLSDNGRPLSGSELREPVGPELLRRLGAEVEVRSGIKGNRSETVLLVRLPTGVPAPAT